MDPYIIQMVNEGVNKEIMDKVKFCKNPMCHQRFSTKPKVGLANIEYSEYCIACVFNCIYD